MKNLKARLLLLMTVAAVAFGFQNCGKVKFSRDGADVLTAVTGSGPTVTPVNGDDNDGDGDDDNDGDDGDVSADTGLNYICILEGSGKSFHIGYSQGLTEDKNTPIAVCMSKSACLDIASQVFSVVSAEKRGFCPNKNKHVIPMTDQEMQAGVDLLK